KILKKYNYNMRLFSDQEYNRKIKQIVKKFCEEHNLRQSLREIIRYKLKKPITTYVYFWDEYTSHCNRRGFVSYASDLGLNLSDTMEMIGTVTEKEMKKYLLQKTDHLKVALNRAKK